MDPKDKDIVKKLVKEWEQELPGLDVSPMQIVGRILNMGRLLEKRVGKVLAPYGIHYSDFDVLATLRRSGKPYALSPKELMASVLITSGAMTALLNRLTHLGLILRIPDSTDGRSTLASLSEKGKSLIDEVLIIRFKEAKDAIGMLDKTEQVQLMMLLSKMSNGLSHVYTATD